MMAASSSWQAPAGLGERQVLPAAMMVTFNSKNTSSIGHR
jgi:hypothetical protein